MRIIRHSLRFTLVLLVAMLAPGQISLSGAQEFIAAHIQGVK